MSEMVERVKAAIAEKMAPAFDARAPYAKVMLDLAARAAIAALRRDEVDWRAAYATANANAYALREAHGASYYAVYRCYVTGRLRRLSASDGRPALYATDQAARWALYEAGRLPRENL